MPDITRLSNLRKLFLVPVFSLRELLLDKMESSDERRAEVRRMPQIQLVQEADRNLAVTEADVDNLHEAYRYGRRLSFQIYLLPPQMTFDILPEDIQAEITFVLDEQKRVEEAKRAREMVTEDVPEIREVAICDYEVFGDTLELRYRYQVAVHYLDDNEEPTYVYDTQYGFIWVNTKDKYLVFVSRDAKISKSLMSGVSRALKVWPRTVTLPKDLINDFFPLENIRRVSHLNPNTGVRHSISGEAEGLKPLMPEIINRESSCSRESALYDEEIDEGVQSKLGVNPRQGKIYLMKTLAASTVRRWGQRTLPDIVKKLREWTAQDPTRSMTTSRVVNRMRVCDEGKAFISSIIDAIAQAKQNEQSDIQMSLCPLKALPFLEGKHLTFSIQNECEECKESAIHCSNCQSTEHAIVDGTLQCAACGTALIQDEDVLLACLNGHSRLVEMNQALFFVPTPGLEEVVSRALSGIGLNWDSSSEHFWIAGDILYLARIPEASNTIIQGDTYSVNIGGDAKNTVVGRDITIEGKFDESEE